MAVAENAYVAQEPKISLTQNLTDVLTPAYAARGVCTFVYAYAMAYGHSYANLRRPTPANMVLYARYMN